jgi:hypothetical protein
LSLICSPEILGRKGRQSSGSLRCQFRCHAESKGNSRSPSSYARFCFRISYCSSPSYRGYCSCSYVLLSVAQVLAQSLTRSIPFRLAPSPPKAEALTEADVKEKKKKDKKKDAPVASEVEATATEGEHSLPSAYSRRPLSSLPFPSLALCFHAR